MSKAREITWADAVDTEYPGHPGWVDTMQDYTYPDGETRRVVRIKATGIYATTNGVSLRSVSLRDVAAQEAR
jgi:hypothetical protein